MTQMNRTNWIELRIQLKLGNSVLKDTPKHLIHDLIGMEVRRTTKQKFEEKPPASLGRSYVDMPKPSARLIEEVDKGVQQLHIRLPVDMDLDWSSDAVQEHYADIAKDLILEGVRDFYGPE
jgi:hypothetical protein